MQLCCICSQTLFSFAFSERREMDRVLKYINGTGRLCKGLSPVFLLFLYAVATLQIDTIHLLFEMHHPVVLHTPELEKAPCHITLYHQDRSGGCEHKTHISEKRKCSLCDSQIQNVHCFLTLEADIIQFATDPDFANRKDLPSNGFHSYSSSRAPPAYQVV